MRCRLLIVCLIVAALPAAAHAHPVPSGAHVRSIVVRVRPTELCVRYRLELDQFTTVYKDSRGLIDDAEVKRFNTPTLFYGEFARRLGPVLGDQLVAALDGRPVALRCIEHHFEVSDHLVCDFLFQADWLPTAASDHHLEFRDNTYDTEQGRVRLSLDEDEAVIAVQRTVPSALLQN